jgi:hypothetical protein
MQKLTSLILILLGMISVVPVVHAKSETLLPLSAKTIEALKSRRALLRTWAPKCPDGSLTMNDCPFWDALEYTGMLCLSGELEYCEQAKRSQNPVTGRFYRSPGFVGMDDNSTDGPTFSNDMDRGVWAYVIATRDKEAATKYLNYVRGNNYKLCPKSINEWNACTTRATYWPFAEMVSDWLGIPRDTKKMKGYKFLIDRLYSPIEAMVQPKTFQMILTAEKLYTLMKLEEKGGKIRNKKMIHQIARIIHRRVPENPLYDFLANGPSERAGENLLNICPSEKPVVPIVNGYPVYTEPANGDWKQGSGHYCIFMINALLGRAD